METMDLDFSVVKRAQLEMQIQELKRLVSQYKGQIDYYNRQIGSTDKSYESITAFKKSVQESQGSFSDINNAKSHVLEQVDAVSINNTVATKYFIGMKRVLAGTGSKIVSKLYGFLLMKIGNEQSVLRNKSNSYSDKIEYYRKLIYKTQAEINLKEQELQSL